MKVSVTTISLKDLDVDLLIIPVLEGAASDSIKAAGLDVDDSIGRLADDFDGKLDSSGIAYPSDIMAKRVALVGLGPLDALAPDSYRRAAAAGANVAVGRKAETVGIIVVDEGVGVEAVSQSLVEGFVLQSYRFDEYKSSDSSKFRGVERVVIHAAKSDKVARRGADRGKIVAEATNTARDLVNLCPSDKTPTLLAKAAERFGKKHGYTTMVLDKAMIEAENMGGLLAVNRGSTEPPTFSVLEWQPDDAVNDRPIVLVGKGVVFDTGGLSLKPTRDSMDYMKSDMAGAAVVIGTMEAVARLELPLYIIGLIPSTDNRPGGNAYVPGDVVRMHSGLTVEVLNTDAEGRMILADALSYAKDYRPRFVIDIATLTGAAVVALGTGMAAMMSNEPERLEGLREAGEKTGEHVWPLPLFDQYKELLDSNVGDIKNVGGREAGTITAAKFLEHFVDYPWIHLDIAGTAFTKKAKAYLPLGGSGFGVRLLVEYLRAEASRKK